jgi:hypothetical protein
MESDVREALRHLTTAFENHLEAVIARRSPEDAAVDDSYEALAEAFERYEESLDMEYGEDLPLMIEEEDIDDVEEDDDLDDEDDDDITGLGAMIAGDDDEDDDEDDEEDDLDEFNLRDE